MEKSDEANEKQLAMAKEQGEAYKKALKHMAEKEADVGNMQAAGDYIVAFAAESAEGMYMMKDGKLSWQEPEEENVHIEITALDGADGRFIPGLTVHVTLTDSNGSRIGRHQQHFLWHPWLYHYGRNWKIPGDGKYTIKVEIEAPDFPRHDKKNGKRFVDAVEVTFKDVQLETGKK
jgi:uncharacterized protein involved in high-affinity Fe2+ transport